MSTFAELQAKMAAAKYKKLILNHLVDYLELEFRPNDGKARKVLLTDEKIAVPDTAFDNIIVDLLKSVEQLDKDIKTISEANVSSKGEKK